MQTAISFGATLVGALLGRRAISAGTVGRATTAARGVGRAQKEAQDVSRASETIAAIEADRQRLEDDLQADTDAIDRVSAIATEPLEPCRGEAEEDGRDGEARRARVDVKGIPLSSAARFNPFKSSALASPSRISIGLAADTQALQQLRVGPFGRIEVLERRGQVLTRRQAAHRVAAFLIGSADGEVAHDLPAIAILGKEQHRVVLDVLTLVVGHAARDFLHQVRQLDLDAFHGSTGARNRCRCL